MNLKGQTNLNASVCIIKLPAIVFHTKDIFHLFKNQIQLTLIHVVITQFPFHGCII